MEKRPLILLTNDDGVHSPGLRAVAHAVSDLGDLLIAAPATQQSGAGRSYPPTMDKKISTTSIQLNGSTHPAFAAKVSPAMAVSLGVLELAPREIDLCISGINYGENIGSGVTVSGTVGAAIEAACYNIPALALSLETLPEYHLSHSEAVDFSVAAHFARLFTQIVLNQGLPGNVDLLKIDVPATATADTPWKTGRVSRQRYYEVLPNQDKPKGVSLGYHTRVNHNNLEPDSDVRIFAVDRQVSVVPMTIDLTAPVDLNELGHMLLSTDTPKAG
jgi:5'-nucleotidase